MKHKLSATKVTKTTKPGMYNDGAGLYLKVNEGGSKSWIFKWRDRHTSKLRNMGLGSLDDVSLAGARTDAEAARQRVLAGGDPILERQQQRAEMKTKASAMLTFDQAAKEYIKAKVEPEAKNPKHVQQWRNTLATYASPKLGHIPINLINDGHILSVLEPIWHKKTETAHRVLQRMARIFDWAAVRKLRTDHNPAQWRGHLDTLLPSPHKIKKVQHMPSLPYAKLYDFMQDLSEREGSAARCLEFTILTATRTSEALGARWEEIDMEGRTWTIPAERMKIKKEHRVPLSDQAMKILKGQQGQHDTYVFPSDSGGKLSNMAMETVLRRMKRKPITVHGFRSTFRTWAAEQTSFPHDVCEQALAHTIQNKATAAYHHSDMLAKRLKLMEAWAGYAHTKPKGQVLQMASA